MKDAGNWNPLAPRLETERSFFERAFRRLAPRAHRRWDRAQRIAKGLAYLGGANLPPQHPLFLEALTRRGSGDVVEYTVLFNNHPRFPLLVRAGTADPNPFRQVFLEHFYRDAIVPGFEPRYILDLGANVGYAALWFAMHYPAARLCAVEPLPSTVTRLRAQLEAAGVIERAVVLENAIDKQAGTRELYVDDDEFLRHACEEALRLHGPVPALLRRAVHDVELDGEAHVAADEDIACLLGPANTDPDVYGDGGASYDPHRFETVGARAAHGLSFGAGAHLCSGRPLAIGLPPAAGGELQVMGVVPRLMRELLARAARPDPDDPPSLRTDTEARRYASYRLVLDG